MQRSKNMRYALQTRNYGLDSMVDNFFRGLPELNSTLTQRAAMDVWESEDGYHIEAELPGVSEKDVAIELVHRTLSIEVKKEENTEEKEKESKYYLRERRNINFSRTFTLPDSADTEQLQAKFSNGLLFIDVPRKEESQPKKIEITIDN